jgi:hypothetical protein
VKYTIRNLTIDRGSPPVQAEGEKVGWHFPEVRHVDVID